MSVRDDVIARVGDIVGSVVSDVVVGVDANGSMRGLDSNVRMERRKQSVPDVARGAVQTMSKTARELQEAFGSPEYGGAGPVPGTGYGPGL